MYHTRKQWCCLKIKKQMNIYTTIDFTLNFDQTQAIENAMAMASHDCDALVSEKRGNYLVVSDDQTEEELFLLHEDDLSILAPNELISLVIIDKNGNVTTYDHGTWEDMDALHTEKCEDFDPGLFKVDVVGPDGVSVYSGEKVIY